MAKLNNIVLCVHGVTNVNEPSSEKTFPATDLDGNVLYNEDGSVWMITEVVDAYNYAITTQEATLYTHHVADIKKIILHLRDTLGYEFVTPDQYFAWWKGTYEPTKPICCVMHDDALSSIKYIMPWYIEQKIPINIPIITQRQGLRFSENGYLTFGMMKKWMRDSNGLVTYMTHTHDCHHTNLQQPNAIVPGIEFDPRDVTVSPILEGPWWVDGGDYIYLDKVEDHPFYFSTSIIESTYGIPLIGIDPYDGTSRITTSFKITPKISDDNISILRIWVSRTIPYSSGYNYRADPPADRPSPEPVQPFPAKSTAGSAFSAQQTAHRHVPGEIHPGHTQRRIFSVLPAPS